MKFIQTLILVYSNHVCNVSTLLTFMEMNTVLVLNNTKATGLGIYQ